MNSKGKIIQPRLLAPLGSASVLLAAMPATFAVLPTAALAADETQGSQLGEIVVTARRREENLQDVPAAITAFSAAMIENAGIKTFLDFANRTPSFYFRERFRPGAVSLTLRGIPSNPQGETPVTILVDGVNVPGLDFINQQLLDIESIQVLKGPQGALYGRGAIAGAILINTRQPGNDLEGLAQVSYADGNDFRFSGSISGPIVTDRSFFRLTGAYVNRDGLVYDQGLGRDADTIDETTVGGQLKLVVSDNLTVDIRGRHIEGKAGSDLSETVTDATYQDYSILPNRDLDDIDDRSIDEWSLSVNYQTAAGTLNSVTGYSKSKTVLTGDADFGPMDIAFVRDENPMEAWSEDIRFVSPDDQRLRWVLGAFFQDRDNRGNLLVNATQTTPFLPPGMVLFAVDKKMNSKVWAAYGQVIYDLSDRMELETALRYDHDKRSIADTCFMCAPASAEGTFSQVQPKVSLKYSWSDRVMTYFSYGRGFRSGGFNTVQATQVFEGAERIYPKEVSDTLEIGLKSTFADGRATLNAAVYHIDFDNQQSNLADLSTGQFAIVSIDKTTIDGVELELVAEPMRGLELAGAVGFTDASIDSYDGTGRLDGNDSPQTPDYTFNLSAQYVHSLTPTMDLFTRIDYRRRGPVYLDEENAYPWDAHDLVDARLSLKWDRFSIGAFVKNLTDKRGPAEFIVNAFGPGVHARISTMPRQYGFEVGIRF